jgi:hypothetical protein
MTHTSLIALAGAAIVRPAVADDVARTAAGELSRYLYLLTGTPSPITDAAAGTAVILAIAPCACNDQGYRLQVDGGTLCITANTSAGLLYGVYGLLERLGMGFYAGGDTFPELPTRAEIPADLDVIEQPAFRVRGNMLHYNFLCGPTTWGLDDYKFYFDQLARMRANMLLMHWYDGEPGAGYQFDGEYLTGGVTPNSLTKPWGAVAALRTSEYSFGTGDYFDAEIFSSPCAEDQPDLLTELKRSEAMFSAATRYARGCGVNVAAGFEAPRTDPADSHAATRFQARVRQFLQHNPDITHFALWQHESGACVGSEVPAAGAPGAALLAERRADFAYLGNEQRVWEAIRYGRFAELALEVMAEERPELPLVMVGWGGDRWMQFADLCLAYDKMMPTHVIFTCHDNIDASMGSNVSTPWGQLPPERERWAMPWVEGDISTCDSRQPHVTTLGELAPDALRKGCQGLMTLQWRTRDVEEETGYIARFAWDTALTPEAFYRDMARKAFGPDQEEAMGDRLLNLQQLGERWTGVRGTGECSAMRWCGWVPHFPFELGPDTADFLIPKVKKAIAALAEVPKTADSEAAFHLIQEQHEVAEETDETRPGVQEMRAARMRLEALRGETDTLFLRRALRAVEEDVYALRPRLVAFGMAGKSYQAIDGFLIAIHQLWRSAGASERMAALRDLRDDTRALRDRYVTAGRTARLERTDYLLATMDYALHFDSAAMLLADGECIDKAIGKATAAREAHEDGKAAEIAAAAYTELLAAGMQQAILAFTRKLTTRCDFGTLTTLNVKPMPRYWETIGWLEAFFPAAPPREVTARGKASEVWLSWEPGRCAAQHLYRRADGGAWERVNAAPLQPGCRMFLDTPAPGRYTYAVTAVSADGWESPTSHLAFAACGPDADAPRLVAEKPFSRLAAGESPLLRVVALSDRDITRVTLYTRRNGEETWQPTPMLPRFRHSYQAPLPVGAPGTLLFYVEAEDAEGRTATWPETGAALPWSATVV